MNTRAAKADVTIHGAVVRLGVERGNPVSAGDTIVELDLRDRKARLTEADSLVVQRELELEGRKNLRTQQFASEVELAEAQNRLDSAWAAKEQGLAALVRRVDMARFRAVRKLFHELGFSDVELEMRTRCYVTYVSLEPALTVKQSKKRSVECIRKFHALITLK